MYSFRAGCVHRAAAVWFAAILAVSAFAQEENFNGADRHAPKIAPASQDGEMAIKGFKPASGLKVDLFAAEPLLANPVCFSIDELGRVYVVETFRHSEGVLDIRGRVEWEDPDIVKKRGADIVEDYMLNEELSLTNHEESNAMLSRHFGKRLPQLIGETEQVSLIYPGADGKGARNTIFATGFNKLGDGIAAGILAYQGNVWFTCIPDLYLFQDPKGTGHADVAKSLQHGYGVRAGFLGHDLHGLRIGPDGKLYFSIGDRGGNVTAIDGSKVYNPEYGAVYRCNQDGSQLEIFAYGLRNPQELTFDEYGNLFTGDNNSDAGDPARWVYVVEGGDSGWRVGYQFIERPKARGPWLMERQCYPYFPGQAAFLVPPIDIIGSGPSGVTHYPGIGFSDAWKGHFFMCDFRGQTSASGVHSFALKPKGAYFEMVDRNKLIWSILATDVDFGYDGRAYISDWVTGWNKTGKGRLYRVFDPTHVSDPIVEETQKLFASGFAQRSPKELAQLLHHPDQRARLYAQLALVEKGDDGFNAFKDELKEGNDQLARVHSIWGLGIIGRKNLGAIPPLLPLLKDGDAEIRAQAAKILGDLRAGEAFDGLANLLKDANPRARFFAAIAIGKLDRKEGFGPVVEMLRENNDIDPYLRHAGVMGLLGSHNEPALAAAAKDSSAAVRMAALLVFRRLGDPRVAGFLHDAEPNVVIEAARAVNDASINDGMPELASLIAQPTPSVPLMRRVINANFRVGGAENARLLAKYAASEDSIEAERLEALQCLQQWAHPDGKERLTGLWRPMQTRDGTVVADALRPFISSLLGAKKDTVRDLAAELAGDFKLTETAGTLFELATNEEVANRVRVRALHSLSQLDDPRLEQAIARASKDPSESVRQEAVRLQAMSKSGGAVDELARILKSGTVGEQQNAFATLATVKDPAVDRILGDYLDELLADKVRPEIRLDLLEAAEKRNNPTLKAKIERYGKSKNNDDGLADYREALYGGDAAEGKKVFFEKPEASCVRCHKAAGEGGEVGPNLSDVGKRQPRQYILESIVYPNKQIAVGFETWMVSLKDGITAYAGTVRSENDDELVLNTPEEGMVKIKKANIAKRERGMSGMPEGLAQVLSRRDLRNLIEFLANQK